MKIIKPGRQQRGWAKEFTCTGAGNGGGGCNAELLVEQGDVYRTFSHHLGESDEHHTFTCGACGVETDIPRPPGEYPQKKDWKAASTPTTGETEGA